MLGFRSIDYVDASDFLYVVGVACFFLFVVYLILRFAKPYFSKQVAAKKENTISIEEIRYLPNIGYVGVFKVRQQGFVTVSNKTGVCITPLIDEIGDKGIVSGRVNDKQESV